MPDGGGYPIAGLLDVDHRRCSGQISNLVTDSKNFGDWYQYFNGVDVTLSLRMGSGATFQGGTSTGQTVADNCDVRANLPEVNAGLGAGLAGSTVSPTSPYCHVAYGLLTQFRGLASYTIPKIDVQVSGVMQSKPGSLLAANYAFPSAVITQALGRRACRESAERHDQSVEPGSMYGNRVNQLDFRVAKLLRLAARETMLGVDLFNALNSGAILSYNNTLRAERHLAAADLDPDRPHGQVQRGVYVLDS